MKTTSLAGWTPTVAIGWIGGIFAAAEKAGVAREALLLAAGGAAIPLNAPLARIPIDQVVRLWRAAVALSGDAMFGLHMGEQVQPGSFNVVAYTLLSSETLRQALGHLQKFQRLISDGARLQMLEQPPLAWLVYHPVQARLEFSPHQVEAVMASIVNSGRWIMGGDFVPLRVCFRHARQGELAEYRRVLGCEPEFGAEFDGLAIAIAALDRHLPAGNPELCRLHESLARQHMAHLEAGASWRARTLQALQDRLALGVCQRDQVAGFLGTSGRVLQRRLAEENTSFVELLDQTRRQLALSYIADPLLGLTQIGALLGFSEPSAFYRAFRRWTGKTPGEYRQ